LFGPTAKGGEEFNVATLKNVLKKKQLGDIMKVPKNQRGGPLVGGGESWLTGGGGPLGNEKETVLA